jgi:hypothetical protein
LIRATLSWSDDDWRAAQHRAVEHAYARFADEIVLRTIFEDWQRIVGTAKLRDGVDAYSSATLAGMIGHRLVGGSRPG